MAGRPKKRIDYAGWSVDIFTNDSKIDKLLDAQGWIGFGIYFFLCQMAFGSDGYYYEWCYDLCASTARKMGGGVGAGTVKETVDYCLQIGLFDKGLFDRWGVLTSRGIQKSYLIVLKSKNRKGTEIYKEYWLLDTSKKEDYQGVVFVSKNSQLLGENVNSLGENEQTLGENVDSLVQKESKGKDSRVKEREWSPQTETRFNDFCELYPKKFSNILVVNGEYTYLLQTTPSLTEGDLIAAVRNYAEACRILKTNERYVKNPENWLKDNTWINYLPENYKKPEGEKKKNKFNQFQQNDYDFEQLERELLGEGGSDGKREV